jgi:hypothetical protein
MPAGKRCKDRSGRNLLQGLGKMFFCPQYFAVLFVPNETLGDMLRWRAAAGYARFALRGAGTRSITSAPLHTPSAVSLMSGDGRRALRSSMQARPTHQFGGAVRHMHPSRVLSDFQKGTGSAVDRVNEWKKLPHHITGTEFQDLIEQWNHKMFFSVGTAMAAGSAGLFFTVGPYAISPWVLSAVTGWFWKAGFEDMKQHRHTIRRNFPVLGRMRYMLEMLRPEIRQYFIEGDREMTPFSREQRSIVYSRAKGQVDTMPLGTRRDVYLEGYEWCLHSMFPTHVTEADARVSIGGPECKKPYSASLLNVSAMSYGALSDNAILALNTGAKMGGFLHNTGEGGMSKFHLQPGGDITFQIGTGYFIYIDR